MTATLYSVSKWHECLPCSKLKTSDALVKCLHLNFRGTKPSECEGNREVYLARLVTQNTDVQTARSSILETGCIKTDINGPSICKMSHLPSGKKLKTMSDNEDIQPRPQHSDLGGSSSQVVVQEASSPSTASTSSSEQGSSTSGSEDSYESLIEDERDLVLLVRDSSSDEPSQSDEYSYSEDDDLNEFDLYVLHGSDRDVAEPYDPKHDPTPDSPYPKPDWFTIKELRARTLGFASSRSIRRQHPYWFERYASKSLYMIQRLQSRRLSKHRGCVNSLDFDSSTNLLCSGSDDRTVSIWDWRQTSNQLKVNLKTGHHDNVFQSLFCNHDKNILTSSRDGSIRLLDIETGRNEELLKSLCEIQKMTFIDENTFMHCGTNAICNMIDLRTGNQMLTFHVKNSKNGSCQLHSIESHPIDKHLIAVAGKSSGVFMYDLRKSNPKPICDNVFVPTSTIGNLELSGVRVTSTAFNSNGDKILISYNDDDLYVCDTKTCEIKHTYRGHRNSATYKGCAWFGDNYVLSGSDDGYIYGWDLESEHIVCFLKGDRYVVNSLLVHPTLPIIASSGIESDIKIWEPTATEWPQTMRGIKTRICRNTKRREEERRGIVNYIPARGYFEDDDDYESEGDDDEDDEDLIYL